MKSRKCSRGAAFPGIEKRSEKSDFFSEKVLTRGVVGGIMGLPDKERATKKKGGESDNGQADALKPSLYLDN